ncbi:MAG: hypothetical protein Q7S92_04360, partial [Candidatus Diapherotrites archaeon]|nr:hypothetical protein [Candidatus Diapherotrites archaeon]
ELKKIQDEMLSDLNSMTSKNLKYMFITLPIFLGVFWVLGSIYEKDVITVIPNFPLNWTWYYILCVIAVSIVLGIVKNKNKK